MDAPKKGVPLTVAGLNCTDLCNCSDNGKTCDNDVQEEDVLYSDECIYMTEPHEQSLTVSITDNHAKIFFGEVKVDFDMLLKLL